jgi:hypothetical protein
VISFCEDGNESLRFIEYCKFIGFEVFTAVIMKSSVLWDIMPCSPLKAKQETSVEQVASKTLPTGFLLGLFFTPQDGGDMFLCQLTFSGLHGIIFQKIEFHWEFLN